MIVRVQWISDSTHRHLGRIVSVQPVASEKWGGRSNHFPFSLLEVDITDEQLEHWTDNRYYVDAQTEELKEHPQEYWHSYQNEQKEQELRDLTGE